MKETKYTIGKATVTIYDPSSNEARRPMLEKACIEFFKAVEKEKKQNGRI